MICDYERAAELCRLSKDVTVAFGVVIQRSTYTDQWLELAKRDAMGVASVVMWAGV